MSNCIVEPFGEDTETRSSMNIYDSEIVMSNIDFDFQESGYYQLYIHDSEIELSNTSFINTKYGLDIDNSEIRLDSLIFRDFASTNQELLDLSSCTGSVKNMVVKNVISNNSTASLRYCDDLEFIDCKIFNNNVRYTSGFYINNSDNIIFQNLTLKNNISQRLRAMTIYNSEVIFSSTDKSNIYNNYSLRNEPEIFSDTFVALVVDTFTVMNPSAQVCYPNENFSFDIEHAPEDNMLVDLYVDPEGDDTNSGTTPDEPFQTIKHAVQHIFPSEDNPLVIHLAEGTYDEIDETGFFTAKNHLTISGAGRDDTNLKLGVSNARIIEQNNLTNFAMSDMKICIEDAYYLMKVNSGSVSLSNVEIEIENYLNTIFYLIDSQLDLNQVKIVCPYNSDEVFDSHITRIIESEASIITATACNFERVIIPLPRWYFRFTNSSARFVNSTISSQIQPIVGFVGLFDSDLYLDHCVWEGESCYDGTYAHINVTQGNVEINNSIISTNNNRFIDFSYYTGNDTLRIDYSLLEGGVSTLHMSGATLIYGDNNLEGDPLFTNPYNLDFTLQNDSPCIDAADPNSGFDMEDPNNAGFPLWPAQGTLLPDMGVYGGPNSSLIDYEDIRAEKIPELPTNSLYNYPNPFNPETKILFSNNITENLKVQIYNIKGQLIRTFKVGADSFDRETNYYSVVWNGADNHNKLVSSGIYFTTLNSGNKLLASRKITLLK